MTTKTCSRCKQKRDVDEFNKDKRYADGYFAWCKECMRDYRKQHYDTPERQRQERDRTRDYHRNNEEFRLRRNEAVNARSRERWHNDPEYRERKNKQKAENIRNNPLSRAKRRLWGLVSSRRRRARKLEAGGEFTLKEWQELCDRYDNVCLCCGKKRKLTPDHVIPLSKGGRNDIENIQPLCLPCNLRKWTKTTDYRK